MTLQSRIISKKTKDLLEKDPLCVISIINGIANPRKIARRLLPQLSKELNFEPKLGSVARSVERYAKEVNSSGKLSGYDIEALKKILAETQVTLRSDIAVIGVRITKDIEKRLVRTIKATYSKEKTFFNVTFGQTYVTIIIDQKNFDKIKKIFGKDVVYSRKDQAAISLITPGDVIGVPGFGGYAFSILGLSGVNIVEVLSSYNEGILIVDNKDANKAYSILKSEIDRIREALS